MALSNGKNLGLLEHGNVGEAHYSELMRQFRGLDVLIQCVVISATLTTPPATPNNGDAYIIPTGATGAWSSQVGKIARWSANLPTPAWEFYTSQKGWRAVVNGAGLRGIEYQYNGTAWVSYAQLPVYADQTAAGAGGLIAGELFITATGQFMVKL